MPIDGVRVYGDSGQPVLLLPGGAESCDGFFPGLREGLLAEPGCRVIEHDRPGTGTSTTAGSLTDAAAHLNALVDELGCGPVVVVGQSLGGAVATLFARDFPDNVAGVVLLDPTPINNPDICARLERTMGMARRFAALPFGPRLIAALLHNANKRTTRRLRLRPDCAAALARTNLDFPQLAAAVHGITEISRAMREEDLPRLPSAVVTADRKPDAAIQLAHQRLATAFGAPLLRWPGATHSVHLDHPDETLATVRDVVAATDRG
ncbi:alpha/beta fold hydrolase [Allokutzneria oryzae]|uniref:Alpha/beta fold hydrolase n=1 Tax=Allokutzneria oryzae TaxID=1378989 RepID=A0ABV6A958_9PSEU